MSRPDDDPAEPPNPNRLWNRLAIALAIVSILAGLAVLGFILAVIMA